MDNLSTCLVGALLLVIPALAVYIKTYLEKATEEQRKETERIRQDMQALKGDQQAGMERIIKQTTPGALTHGINDNDIELKRDVELELEKLRSACGATRVTLWSFHNGSYYSTGNPQRKIQTTFEALPPDRHAASEADVMQNESVNGFIVVLQPMMSGAYQVPGGAEVDPGVTVFGACEKCKCAAGCDMDPYTRPRNCILCCNIGDMPFGSRFYRLMKQLGTKTWFGRFLSDEDGNKLGVMTVQFSEGEDGAAEVFLDKSDAWCETCVRVVASIQAMRQYS